MTWLYEEWNYFQSNRGLIEALRQTDWPPVLFSAVQHLSFNLREILNGFSTIIVFCYRMSHSGGFCYNVFVGSRVSVLTLVRPLCWRKAAFGSPHSPLPEVCSELPFWDASGFLLMTSSSLLPDSAMRGTTKQQSKSLVRTWFTCRSLSYGFKPPRSPGPAGRMFLTYTPFSNKPSETLNPKSSPSESLYKVTCGGDVMWWERKKVCCHFYKH